MNVFIKKGVLVYTSSEKIAKQLKELEFEIFCNASTSGWGSVSFYPVRNGIVKKVFSGKAYLATLNKEEND